MQQHQPVEHSETSLLVLALLIGIVTCCKILTTWLKGRMTAPSAVQAMVEQYINALDGTVLNLSLGPGDAAGSNQNTEETRLNGFLTPEEMQDVVDGSPPTVISSSGRTHVSLKLGKLTPK